MDREHEPEDRPKRDSGLDRVIGQMEQSLEAPGEALPKAAVMAWLVQLRSYRATTIPQSQRPRRVGEGIHKRRT
jgi:hypothetical protein